MVLVYILVCSVPFLIIFMVFAAIAAAGLKVGRTGKIVYQDLKPYIDDLKEKSDRAQKMGMDFADRGVRLQKTFEEISGRWAFITQTFQETTQSPVVKLASYAGRFTGGRKS